MPSLYLLDFAREVLRVHAAQPSALRDELAQAADALVEAQSRYMDAEAELAKVVEDRAALARALLAAQKEASAILSQPSATAARFSDKVLVLARSVINFHKVNKDSVSGQREHPELTMAKAIISLSNEQER